MVIVLLAREFIVSGLRTIAASEGMVIAAGQEGKWKTSLQLCGIISLCVHYVTRWTFWWKYPVDFNVVGKILIYLSRRSAYGSLACTSGRSWRCSQAKAEARYRALDASDRAIGYIRPRFEVVVVDN